MKWAFLIRKLAAAGAAGEVNMVRSYSLTDKGRVRSSNQDYAFVTERPIGKLPNLFVVADGMGGHQAGDRASSYAVEVFLKGIRESREKNPIRAMRLAVEKANEKVYEEALSRREYQGMGTTLVAATLVRDTLYVVNVGDSRLYLVGSSIRQVTRDHSLVEEMVRTGSLTREEGKKHPDRNIITRAVGVSDMVAVDAFEEKIEAKDVILLCSDGLTNMVEDRQIQQIIRQAKNLQKAAEMLVDTANDNGGRDNITVLLVSRKSNEVRSC